MAADDGSGTLTIPRPIETFEQLCEVFLPTVAARIWAACCWPKGTGNGWNIGDYRFAVIAVSPEPKTRLYVQFWSEPGEEVLMEVCSGEWSPGSVKYVQKPQRELLRTLGFSIGGEARNFRKALFITKVSEAEAAAHETLRILFDGFRFRGQWPLEIQVERASRSEQRLVYSSFTPEDFAKLLSEHGYLCRLDLTDDAPVALLQRGKRRFEARFGWRLPRQNLYSVVALDALIAAPMAFDAKAMLMLESELPGLSVKQFQGTHLRLSMPLMLDGGVTTNWVLESVGYWLQAVRRGERIVRMATAQRRQTREVDNGGRVH